MSSKLVLWLHLPQNWSNYIPIRRKSRQLHPREPKKLHQIFLCFFSVSCGLLDNWRNLGFQAQCRWYLSEQAWHTRDVEAKDKVDKQTETEGTEKQSCNWTSLWELHVCARHVGPWTFICLQTNVSETCLKSYAYIMFQPQHVPTAFVD